MRKMLFGFATFALVLLVLEIQVIPTALAAPSVSGRFSAPSSIEAGRSFTVSTTISNYGSTPVYSVKVTISVPSGFSANRQELFFGDIGSGRSKTQSFQATAPNYGTSGAFSGIAFYSDNMIGKGTMGTAYVWGSAVYVYSPKKYSVTFVVLATWGQIKSAVVSVYDSSGSLVAQGGNIARDTTSPVYVQVSLSAGSYRASALGVVSAVGGPPGSQKQSVGLIWITVCGGSSFTIALLPFP